MNADREQESGLWKHGLLLTLLFGFTVMIVGGLLMYRSRAPIPERVTSPDGATLSTAADIQQGQDLFRKRGLMDYGTVLGAIFSALEVIPLSLLMVEAYSQYKVIREGGQRWRNSSSLSVRLLVLPGALPYGRASVSTGT